ncbi:CAAX farnesyltransferase (FTase) subunit beta [Tulasnella sp. JGI-2019a]|nr:CAAX farnesyltransferase (FTase) subunit beta [Tulasnella sp. JGI-2019a]KAG9006588.1 CAAX farnesyltransferase (FTase) subunit beta [Tulasnella sp. JGI-2019a]
MAATVLTRAPHQDDGFETDTSKVQKETEQAITMLLEATLNTRKPMTLQKNVHINWALRLLLQGFPARFTSQDASRTWLLYFLLQTFQTLGVAFDPDTKKKAIRTIMPMQHPNGGFGGGVGQFPHVLATYAAICCMVLVGSPGPEGGWDQIDRQKMYQFFMSLKQPDGSFIVCPGGEVDVRATYCLLVIATLLDILTPELVHNTYGFIKSCQTYEGGFAASSQPYFSPSSELLSEPRPYLGEAHGGYTSCAVASMIMMRPLVSAHVFPGVNGQALLRWAVMMQGSEFDECGGFRGRTNKLVDGCYTWWVGSLFTLIEEILGEGTGEVIKHTSGDNSKHEKEEDWLDVDDSLMNREALQRYVLVAAQVSTGGLRDKPNLPSDPYHTLYNLSGLASAQHRTFFSTTRAETIRKEWVDAEGLIPTSETPQERLARRRETFVATCAWMEDEGASKYVGGAKDNRVNAVHPVFNLLMTPTREAMNHFYGQKINVRY